MKAVTPIKCKIPSLKLAIQVLPENPVLEERLLHLEHLDEQHRDVLITNEEHKQHMKSHYDKSVKSRVFSEGDLVLVYDQGK